MTYTPARPSRLAEHPYRLGLAGAIALLLGIGLGRFAYTPIIPALVHAGWFTESQTAYLGAANLLGYMLGAWCAHRLSLRLGERRVLFINLAVLSLSLLCCALPWGFAWYTLWRLLAGVAGGVLTVVGASAVLVRVPAARRPVVSALVFTGPSVGIFASASVVPWLAGRGVAVVWLGVGILAAVLFLWSWLAVWRHLEPADHGHQSQRTKSRIPHAAVLLVIAAYGLAGVGGVPHALFWVDYIARELGRGLAAGSQFWMLFGVGSLLGPALAGAIAARTGFRTALIAALAATAVSVGLPLISVSAWALVLSSLLVGAMTPAFVTLAAGSLSELVTADKQEKYWGQATLFYAFMMVASSYGFSAIYSASGSYVPLFAIGAGTLIVASFTAGCARLAHPVTA